MPKTQKLTLVNLGYKKSDYDIMSFGFCINIKIQFSVPNMIKLKYNAETPF